MRNNFHDVAFTPSLGMLDREDFEIICEELALTGPLSVQRVLVAGADGIYWLPSVLEIF